MVIEDDRLLRRWLILGAGIFLALPIMLASDPVIAKEPTFSGLLDNGGKIIAKFSTDTVINTFYVKTKNPAEVHVCSILIRDVVASALGSQKINNDINSYCFKLDK